MIFLDIPCVFDNVFVVLLCYHVMNPLWTQNKSPFKKLLELPMKHEKRPIIFWFNRFREKLKQKSFFNPSKNTQIWNNFIIYFANFVQTIQLDHS